jgi:hypothetical protein
MTTTSLTTGSPQLADLSAPQWVDVTKSGEPKPTMMNVRAAIQALNLECRFDVFHNKYLVEGSHLGQYVGEISEPIARKLRELCRVHFGFDPLVQAASDGIQRACEHHRFDPIQDYLSALKWDGKARLDTWLIDYCGAADTPLNRAIGKLVLVAAVTRAFDHGCKFDHVMIWESPEGYNKSSAIRILAGGAENFSDSTILDVDERKQMELTKGIWFYELAELAGMKKADVDAIKRFITAQEERARPAYARFQEVQPRRNVFIGSVNTITGAEPGDTEYLTSTTGNRRWWPIPVGRIDTDRLEADRDQLFAEAMVEYELVGFSLRLDPSLWEAAAVEQRKREVSDPWGDKLATLDTELVRSWKHLTTKEREEANYYVTDSEVWLSAGELYGRLPPTNDARRIASLMSKLGWTRTKDRRLRGMQLRGFARARSAQEQGT